MEEAIITGVTGLLVEPLAVDDVARQIIKLLTDPEYARELGRNGRQRVEEELNWETTCKNLSVYL